MKQIFVYVLFFVLPWPGSAVVSDSSALRQENSALKLKVSVQDVYGYLEADKTYRLEESRFDFKVWEEKAPVASGGKSGDFLAPAVADGGLSEALLVDEGHITQKPPAGSARHLSVSQDRVSLQSSNGRKVAVRSRLSDKRDTLVIYLPEQTKNNILNRLLTRSHLSLALWEEKAQASDYICTLDKKTRKLVCSISYVSQSPLPETGKKAG